MSKTVIKVKDLSKLYHLGELHKQSNSFRDKVTNFFKNREEKKKNETLWALKDISFEVKQGEVVGIIGRNGAGKSTLLKILSRITRPTKGKARIDGRVASLLEVGTGFHPELTGRENIHLNGSILGMKRTEIVRKFDEIVAFAEIEKFIDTPVKRYSSGMYVRLAFAVAAHLEPEILLVDEVLAVGDISFQKKCLGTMGDVAKEGRTVLFISHNMAAISNLCKRTILLVNGKNEHDGPTNKVIETYLSVGNEFKGEQVWHNQETAPGNDIVRLQAVRIISDGEITEDVDIQKDVNIEMEFWNLKAGAFIYSGIILLDKMGVGVLASSNVSSVCLADDGWYGRPHPPGLFRSTCVLPGNFLNEGQYKINAIIGIGVSDTQAFAEQVLTFTVHDTGAMRKEFMGGWLGVVRPRLDWKTDFCRPFQDVKRL